MPIPEGYSPLPGSERPQVPGSTLIGAVERSESVAATLRLRPRADAPSEYDLEHWQRTPPHGRRFLSADEYMRSYGSSAEDVEAVTRWLTAKGLNILEADTGRRRILVEGPPPR